MSFYARMLARLNYRFHEDRIGELSPEMFDRPLAEVAEDLKIARTREEADFIAAIPGGMHDAARALIQSNLSREQPLEMTFAWAPGYDYELRIWEAPGTPESRGSITVLFRSQYPSEMRGTRSSA
jgi:hypothetical protein